LVFDVTRKITYQHLADWYKELREYVLTLYLRTNSLAHPFIHGMHNFTRSFTDSFTIFRYCEDIPCVLVANKIDVDYNVVKKEFKFASNHNLPIFYVSAADGTNVVKVFKNVIREAKRFKASGGDVLSSMLDLLDESKSVFKK